MKDIINAVATHWASQGLEAVGGASPLEIQAFEDCNQVRLPADVAAYLAQLNGTRDGAMDKELISFWSLDRVASVATELGHQEPVAPAAEEFYCFADYSVWCNAYAVRLSATDTESSPVVAVYSGVDLVPVAESFSQFLHSYLRSPAAVLHPEWKAGDRMFGTAT